MQTCVFKVTPRSKFEAIQNMRRKEKELRAKQQEQALIAAAQHKAAQEREAQRHNRKTKKDSNPNITWGRKDGVRGAVRVVGVWWCERRERETHNGYSRNALLF